MRLLVFCSLQNHQSYTLTLVQHQPPYNAVVIFERHFADNIDLTVRPATHLAVSFDLKELAEHINKLLVVANESYDEFAKALQTEYEQDCGVTFGKIPIYAFTGLVQVINGEGVNIGRDASEKIFKGLVAKGIITESGKIQPTFDPKDSNVDLGLAPEHADLRSAVVDILQSYQLERHIKKDEDGQRLRLKKEVTLDPAFQELWNRIKAKTTYSVEYQTETLISPVSIRAHRFDIQYILPLQRRIQKTCVETYFILQRRQSRQQGHISRLDVISYLRSAPRKSWPVFQSGIRPISVKSFKTDPVIAQLLFSDPNF